MPKKIKFESFKNHFLVNANEYSFSTQEKIVMWNNFLLEINFKYNGQYIIIYKGSKEIITLKLDNNEIKLLINEKFPSIKTFFKRITHLGEANVLERENVKNTMLDFYLLSYTNSIYSFTCYPHGSGFSYWCAQTYNIPYKCKYINI